MKEIEEELLAGHVDLGVHSAKDLPGVLPDGLAILGTPPAEDPSDALAGGARALAELPPGARVGTSSLRRRSQLLAIRPDLAVTAIRGNVDTRLRKLAAGDHDAIVLALAGLRRLGREDDASAVLGVDEFVPAPGQGVLALEGRAGDAHSAEIARQLNDVGALARLTAERAVVRDLDTSCHTPIGVHARARDGGLLINAYVGLPDGSEWIRDRVDGDGDPEALGAELARRLLAAGAGELLRRAHEA